MTISSTVPAPQSPQLQATERTVAVLKKSQDVAEAQAEGLIALIQTATREGVGTRLSVYA
jgi:hypothetical protein